LTSLIAEAPHRSPAGVPPALSADSRADQVEVRIADHRAPEGQPEERGRWPHGDHHAARGGFDQRGASVTLVTRPARNS
jgi:hypothetical protein